MRRTVRLHWIDTRARVQVHFCMLVAVCGAEKLARRTTTQPPRHRQHALRSPKNPNGGDDDDDGDDDYCATHNSTRSVCGGVVVLVFPSRLCWHTWRLHGPRKHHHTSHYCFCVALFQWRVHEMEGDQFSTAFLSSSGQYSRAVPFSACASVCVLLQGKQPPLCRGSKQTTKRGSCLGRFDSLRLRPPVERLK